MESLLFNSFLIYILQFNILNILEIVALAKTLVNDFLAHVLSLQLMLAFYNFGYNFLDFFYCKILVFNNLFILMS